MPANTNRFFSIVKRDGRDYVEIKYPLGRENVNKFIPYQGFHDLLNEFSQSTYHENDTIKAKEFRVLLNKSHYRVYSPPEVYVHRWGFGGEVGSATIFKKDGKLVLVSLKLHCWDTLSDDSEDYPTGNREITSLLEDDPLAMNLFEKIRVLGE
ncbi:hypothetical protein HYW75_05065 [Candidatus Pacearchaeota archaeon]|nr:hypothetical protein [Candidatus Pacearchaeota archaeon]